MVCSAAACISFKGGNQGKGDPVPDLAGGGAQQTALRYSDAKNLVRWERIKVRDEWQPRTDVIGVESVDGLVCIQTR